MSVPSLSSSMSVSTLSSLSLSILCFPLCLSLVVTLVYPYFSPRCHLYFSPRCPLYLSPGVPFFQLGIGIDLVPTGHILRILFSQGVGVVEHNIYIYIFLLDSPPGVALYIYISFFLLDTPGVASLKQILV